MSLGTLYSGDSLCPFSHRVLIAARESGASIDTVYGRDIPDTVKKANKNGGWPVFVPADGGELLDDSSKIVDYLIAGSGEEGKAYRSDPTTMAKLDPLVMNISKVIRAGKPAIQNEAREKLDRALSDVAAILAASGGTFLGGDRFSQADGHVTPFLYRLPFLVEVRDHVPAIFLENAELSAWVDRVVNRKSFREIAPKRHMVRQFYAEKARYGKPMKVGRLHHSGFRGMWNDLVARTAALANGKDENNEDLQEARDLCYLLFRAVSLHAKFENLILFPALDAAKDNPDFTSEGAEQHEHEVGEMNSLLDLFDRALSEEPGERGSRLKDLAVTCARHREGQFAHLDYEEANFMPVLNGLEVDQHLDMLRGAYEMCILERPFLIGVLASYMPIENTLSLLDSASCDVSRMSCRLR
jgi:glutathione S-transferase